MKYINTTRDKTSSDYVRIVPSVDGSVVTFSVKQSRPSIMGTVVPMVAGRIRLSTPATITPCDPSVCGGEVTEAVALDFNVRSGNITSLTALRTEVNRVLDVAIAQYNLVDGIVPPVVADFAGE